MSRLYRRLVRWFERPVRAYSRLVVKGREHLPTASQPGLLAPNHSGSLWWDAICLAAAVPERQIRTVAQHWDSQSRLLRALLKPVDALYMTLSVDQIDRTNEVVRALEKNDLLCLFPEQSYHTFRDRYTLFRFAPQTLKYAELARVPIIPTAVIGVEEAAATLAGWKRAGMPFHVPWLPPVILPFRVTIEFGPPRTFEELTQADGRIAGGDAYQRGADRLQQVVADIIRAYRPCATSDLSYLDESRVW